MEWNDETILTLSTLWDEGHSTSEIGRRMRCTKNSIVGKAHRLDLPGRPSPISQTGEPRAYAYVPPRLKYTLPALPSETRVDRRWFTEERLAILRANWPTYKAVSLIMSEMSELPGPELPSAHVIANYASNSLQLCRPDDFRRKTTPPRMPFTNTPAPRKRTATQRPALIPQVYARITGCCWPIGEVGTKEFRFCDEPHENRAYCDEHQKIAYVRPRRNEEFVASKPGWSPLVWRNV